MKETVEEPKYEVGEKVGEEEKAKRYRTKKRRVNRQTQEVYLQRLVASSERKTRNLKSKKLQF